MQRRGLTGTRIRLKKTRRWRSVIKEIARFNRAALVLVILHAYLHARMLFSAIFNFATLTCERAREIPIPVIFVNNNLDVNPSRLAIKRLSCSFAAILDMTGN